MPASRKVIFFGNANTGKTSLVQRIKDNNFQEKYKPTIGSEFRTIVLSPDNHVQIWDHAGQERYRVLLGLFSKDSHLGIYCISSENDIDEGLIKKDIELVRKNHPKLPVVIVLTKSDLLEMNRAVLHEKLNQIKALNIPDCELIGAISAKNKSNLDLLTEKLSIRRAPLRKSSLYEAAKRDLQVEMEIYDVSQAKRIGITLEIQKMEESLSSDNKKNAEVIALFTKKSKQIIKNDSTAASIMNAILSLAAAVSVTLIVGAIGFGIGLAAGAWTGPGAFITAFVAGEMAATQTAAYACALGLITGVNTAFNLFSTPSTFGKIDKLAEEASDDFVSAKV